MRTQVELGLRPGDAWIFDTTETFHSAFRINAGKNVEPRRSIEGRYVAIDVRAFYFAAIRSISVVVSPHACARVMKRSR